MSSARIKCLACFCIQVSQEHFKLVQEMSNQNEDTKADEEKREKKATKKGTKGWDDAKKKQVNGFLYSPEAYAVEKELQSPYEDSIHEIMNCPVRAGCEATLGHIYDVVYLANCKGQDPQNDEPEVKRLSSSSRKDVQKLSSTYGIAVLYVAFPAMLS